MQPHNGRDSLDGGLSILSGVLCGGRCARLPLLHAGFAGISGLYARLQGLQLWAHACECKWRICLSGVQPTMQSQIPVDDLWLASVFTSLSLSLSPSRPLCFSFSLAIFHTPSAAGLCGDSCLRLPVAGVFFSLGQGPAGGERRHGPSGHRLHPEPVQGARRELRGQRDRQHAQPWHIRGEFFSPLKPLMLWTNRKSRRSAIEVWWNADLTLCTPWCLILELHHRSFF